MKKIISASIAFLLPSRVASILLNLLGHQIHPTAKIGFSILLCEHIRMAKQAQIGSLNFINIQHLSMNEKAFIVSKNRMNGPMNIILDQEAAIARSNSIYRAKAPISQGMAQLKLGKLTQIVSQNQLDLTKSITMGDYVTIGGHGGQFWTHGFVHAPSSPCLLYTSPSPRDS